MERQRMHAVRVNAGMKLDHETLEDGITVKK